MTTDELLAITGPLAWVQAMLDVEAALALAEAEAGLLPATAAEAIARCCDAESFDVDQLAGSARLGGNPVIPLVELLTERAGEAGRWVHMGATSQDVLDTAAVLVSRRAAGVIDRHLGELAAACAALANDHRHTLMAARTLLQQALPITFGLKAAGWLVAVMEVRDRLSDAAGRLAVQLGGAVGTLASLEGSGPEVVIRLCAHLNLSAPVVPWHADRFRTADLATALGLVAGAVAKIASDVALLMQTELSEALEPAAPGRGASSSMAHKRNPVGAAAVSTAARRAHALVPVMLGAMVVEHERALGGWQAEWQTLTELLRLAGGAAARGAETVSGLEVHPERMAHNLGATAGLVMAERITSALAGPIGRPQAKRAVGEAAGRAQRQGSSFATELLSDPAVSAVLGREELERLLEPSGYLGDTEVLVERALRLYRDVSGGER